MPVASEQLGESLDGPFPSLGSTTLKRLPSALSIFRSDTCVASVSELHTKLAEITSREFQTKLSNSEYANHYVKACVPQLFVFYYTVSVLHVVCCLVLDVKPYYTIPYHTIPFLSL